MRYFTISLLSFILSIAVIAQESCSVFVTDALATLDSICEATSRNELCYGNTLVSVMTNSGEELSFSQPGDIVPIVDIASIRTSPYAEPDEWGIALMRVQADIPDTLPGINVTFLLFGDVNLTNAGSVSASLSALTTSNINVRSDPSTNHAVAGSLQAGVALELIARNAAGDWVYFTTEDGTTGWLFASLLQIEGDVMSLDAVPDDFAGTSQVKPMQAVYFSSGVGQTSCNGVPRDGLLIQTPDYEQPIELVVNDVEIRLGSTVYLQAEAGNEMTVYVVEGFAFVTANDETVNVPQGAVTNIAMDEDLHATGTPSEPEPYVIENVSSAPVSSMDEEVEIAEPATEEDIRGLTVVVEGNAGWVDTGIQVAAGQTIVFSASGEINVWVNCETQVAEIPTLAGYDCNSMTFGPNGGYPIRNGVELEGSLGDRPAIDMMPHSLIGRIGNEASFLIGESRTMVATVDGTLFITLNDPADGSNSGEFVVTIFIL